MFVSGIARFSDDRGGVLVMVAIWLPVLLIFAMFVIDVGNWFEHRRHLQMQADAGALAGGNAFNGCLGYWNGGPAPSPDPAAQKARQYAGDPTTGGAYNGQIGGTNKGSVTVLINSKNYAVSDPSAPDNTDTRAPCASMMVDVKATEAGIPLFFGRIPTLFGRPLLPQININTHARVRLFSETVKNGSLPVSVPDPGFPVTAAAVEFINEDTGASLGSANLTSAGSGAFSNVSAPVSVNMVGALHVGAVIKLTGATPAPAALTCGQPLVQCYDLSSLNASGSPTRGALFIHGYPTAGYSTGVSGEPVVRSVTLLAPGAAPCANPYFFVIASGNCQVGVQADVAFADATGNNRSVSATLSDYTTPTPDYTDTNGLKNTGGTTWASDGTGQAKYFNVPAQEGPVKVTLSWTKKAGNYNGRACTSSNPCSGDWNGFVFQRTMSGGDSYSGPISSALLCQGSGPACVSANSFASDGSGTSHALWVNVQMQPSLGYATSVSSPPVYLRVQGSQNQTIDCDPALPNLRQELKFGCGPQYKVNPIVPGTGFSVNCSSWPTSNNSWNPPNYAQPWPCVTVQTGGAGGQVTPGIEDRMTRLAGTTCPTNNWSSFPSFSSSDPRLVGVVLTPFGSFGGSGNANIPVTGFAEFYITGWAKSGTGSKHPQADCTGDDKPPGADYIVGHFVMYVDSINNGGATTPCAFTTLGNCVPVLTD